MKAFVAGAVLAVLIPASTTTYPTNHSKHGILMVTKPFQSFGNFTNGDCQYETAANLILAQWPTSVITTSEVLAAYRSNGIAWGSNGLEAGQNYLISTGFDGHHAASITTLNTRQSIIDAANNGGVEVQTLGQNYGHMFAMIQADSKNVTLVDEGFVYHYTWKWLMWAYTQNETLTFQAVKWAS
jgi:hypothetical protein